MSETETEPITERAGPLANALDAFRALFQRPSTSLPSRITILVFAGTLLTSLVVTWISTHSIHAFLSEKINEQFPATLASARERLNLWYSQRRLDLDTFSRSATLVENLEALQDSEGDPEGRVSRHEIHNYLSYVLERFDQYEALFVLDPDGTPRIWIGTEVHLPDRLRSQLARVSDSGVGNVFPLGGRRFQVASAVISTPHDRPLGTLHALLRLDSIERLLRSEDVGAGGRIFVVGRDGGYVTNTQTSAAGEAWGRPLPESGALPQVDDYTDPTGQRVVGSALRFDRFDWAIVVEEPYGDAFAPVVRVIWRVLAINLAIVILFGLIALQIASSIVRPIRALSEGARRVGEGETDVVIMEAASPDEIGLLTRTFNKMTARLHRNRLELQQNRLEIEAANSRLRAQNEELQRVNEALEELSTTDGLTKLFNHRYFQEQLAREAKRAARTQEPLTLVLMDIDNFKQLNDRHGHAAGDSVLRQMGSVLAETVRETDLLARYGGEEFALLATQTDLDGATGLAEKLRMAVSEAEFQVEGDQGPVALRVTVSVGVARFTGDRSTLFNDADRALYRAKASGKDCVVSEAGS